MLTSQQNLPIRSESWPVHPFSALRVIWKHKWRILIAWAVLTAVAVAIVYRLPTPNRVLWNAVGCAAALFLCLAIAVVREIRTGVVLGEWELPPGVVVIARVPKIAVEWTSSCGPRETRSWLQKRWQALVFSVVVTLACGMVAVFYHGWIDF